jgi:hypothetical protein
MKVITSAMIPFTLSKILLTFIAILLIPAMKVNAFAVNVLTPVMKHLTFAVKVNTFSITPNQKGKENTENFLCSAHGL